MSTIINGTSSAITFPDSSVQNTSAVVGSSVPYSILPTGSVLQVVQGSTSTPVSNSTSTSTDTTLTATITPKFATSKILVIVDQNGCGKQTSDTAINVVVMRNSTNISNIGNVVGYTGNSSLSYIGTIGGTILDSPATTSAVTYKTQFSSWQNNAITAVQFQSTTSTITLMEIAG